MPEGRQTAKPRFWAPIALSQVPGPLPPLAKAAKVDRGWEKWSIPSGWVWWRGGKQGVVGLRQAGGRAVRSGVSAERRLGGIEDGRVRQPRSGPASVAQASSLPYRGFPIRIRGNTQTVFIRHRSNSTGSKSASQTSWKPRIQQVSELYCFFTKEFYHASKTFALPASHEPNPF